MIQTLYDHTAGAVDILTIVLFDNSVEQSMITFAPSSPSPHAHKIVKSRTLRELKVDYLDLYLMHWPQAFQHVDGSNRSFPKNDDGSMK